MQLEKLKMSDFTTWKGQLLPNSEQYEKIFELWNEFDKVRFIYAYLHLTNRLFWGICLYWISALQFVIAWQYI